VRPSTPPEATMLKPPDRPLLHASVTPGAEVAAAARQALGSSSAPSSGLRRPPNRYALPTPPLPFMLCEFVFGSDLISFQHAVLRSLICFDLNVPSPYAAHPLLFPLRCVISTSY
jgi:hypothetical protein